MSGPAMAEITAPAPISGLSARRMTQGRTLPKSNRGTHS